MDQQILNQVWQWKQEGWTFSRIGEKVGLTRQRVHQILEKEERRRGEKYKRVFKTKVDVICTTCQKSFKRLQGYVKQRNFCSLRCWGIARREYFKADGRSMIERERLRFRYHNDPEYRKRIRAKTAVWNQKRMADPEYRERKRQYARDYYQKHRRS